MYTSYLDWKICLSQWAGPVSRQTQRRTVNPLPFSGVAGSLRTSEAPIHLQKYPQIFPSLAALGGPPQPGQSCQPEGLDKTVSVNRKWLLISKHGKANSISCFVRMPHSIKNKTKTTYEKIIHKQLSVQPMSNCTKQLIKTHLCNTQYNWTQQLRCSPVQSFQPKGLDRSVSVDSKWLFILKHGKESSISCFVRMPHSIKYKTKMTW